MIAGAASLWVVFLSADLMGFSSTSSRSFCGSRPGDPGSDSESDSKSLPYLSPFSAMVDVFVGCEDFLEIRASCMRR